MHGLGVGLPIILAVVALVIFGPKVWAALRPPQPAKKAPTRKPGLKGATTSIPPPGAKQVYEPKSPPPPASIRERATLARSELDRRR